MLIAPSQPGNESRGAFTTAARRVCVPPLLCCLIFAPGRAGAAEVAFHLTDAKGQPVADAVVSLVPLEAPAKLTPPAEPLVIAQQKQEFVPYVTPLIRGTAVKFPNQDTVKHQVYTNAKAKKFELPLYAGEAKEAIVFDQPGIVPIGCNIHDWMLAYIVVLETPWFAKSGADGMATIAAVPAGRYQAEIWQPRLKPGTAGKREISVTESTAPPIAVSLELDRDRRIRRSPDAKGGGYK